MPSKITYLYNIFNYSVPFGIRLAMKYTEKNRSHSLKLTVEKTNYTLKTCVC